MAANRAILLDCDFEIRFSVLIEMFVASISFRGTSGSFWDLTEVSAQSWYRVRSYHLVNPTVKISLILRACFLGENISESLIFLFKRGFLKK